MPRQGNNLRVSCELIGTLSIVVARAPADWDMMCVFRGRPFHWLYDAAKLAEIVGDKEPEFWPESHSPFYTLPTGRRSCYNDEGIAMLFSLPKGAATSPAAAFDAGAVIASLQDMFSPTSEYAESLKLRAIAYHPSR